MFEMSSFCPPSLGWEYPLELGTNQAFPNFNLDSVLLVDFSSSQAQVYQECDHIKRSESPQDTSSTDPFIDNDNNNNNNDYNPILLSKKINHNASERVRRKKISNLYSSLRNLLPESDQRKKLSIPGTVVRVVEYIPELQKEVDALTRKRNELLPKVSALQGNASDFIPEKKQKVCTNNETMSCSISANKLGDKEMVIQISAFERISLSEVILLLEKYGYAVLDISSFQSFGGTTFYNIHLRIEGSYSVNFETVNETLLSLLEKQKQKQKQKQVQVYFTCGGTT
ncbi:transcription factor bHLH101-like [Beta vulgaris subsp. vulgaris]|uniref:transcription factor bHLH101-like n=1 Tax=Beta vulgaris subsp. vulgaris TaxID=3555 RepID=UPI002036FA95|nr:transcription factor bHLH101-like [Beta vulgaris subsp. vulgaris]